MFIEIEFAQDLRSKSLKLELKTCSQILRKFYFNEHGLYLREATLENNRVKLLNLLILSYHALCLFLFETIFMMRFFEIGRNKNFHIPAPGRALPGKK